jgi:hypothetical protein
MHGKTLSSALLEMEIWFVNRRFFYE